MIIYAREAPPTTWFWLYTNNGTLSTDKEQQDQREAMMAAACYMLTNMYIDAYQQIY
jgi:hypothetical protein